ncbi:MAG: CHASE2 domain-containing protein [Leptolyngbyaceae cyanobacterium CSU_1_3]|nr:CHASE2 domain-containing protein [Leptolyngbyaceae cyanobacterium CSU_1_3]
MGKFVPGNLLSSTIARPNQVLNGYITTTSGFLELLPQGRSCKEACPFASMLALAHLLKTSPSSSLPQPSNNQQNFRSQVLDYLESSSPPQVKQLQQARLPLLTSISQVAAQEWLHPILDFSLPPTQAYQQVSAHQFLEASFKPTLQSGGLPPIVLIAPGGYSEAGINQPGEDNYAVPLAIADCWQAVDCANERWFTGAEFHAYAIHHLLNQRWLIPIPDVWMLGVAIVLAKGIVLVLKLKRHNSVSVVWFILGTALYGLVGLQLYVVGVVLPWLLPSVLFWVLIQPVVRRESNAA